MKLPQINLRDLISERFTHLRWAKIPIPVTRKGNFSRQNQTIGHQFPQVLHLKIFKIVFAFYVIKLPVATVAGNHNHFCPCGPYLVDFFSGIKDTLIIIPGSHGSTASATADLIHFIGIKIDPVFKALIHNPARFIKKAMAETFLGSSSIIAWIMVGDKFRKLGSVQSDTTLFNICYEQIKNRYKSKFIKNFGIIFLKTRPGRKVCVASFGPEKGFDLKLFHLLHNPNGHDLHGIIVTCKISPTGSLPVFRSYGPVFFGRMKNFPPVL